MRLHRLRLRDVKGVRDRTVEFPDSGVVVIEGPNEVGKTTLLEAFDLLLDPRAKATSQSRAVRALKPLDRDAGPRVEAEFTLGDHRVRFAKQWLRGPSTELEILTPVREQHTGEQAQQRMDAILAQALDRPLWDALRFTQAGELGQMALTESAVLTEALDGASGLDLHAAEGGPLLEQVERELRRYYTATGRLTGELREAVLVATTARDDAVHAHRAVTETQALVERAEQLREAVGDLTAGEQGLLAALTRAQELDAHVTELVRAHEESTAALARAREDSVRATDDLARREQADQDLTEARERLAAAEHALAVRTRELDDLREATAGLVAARDLASAERDAAGEVADRAAADVDRLSMRERAERLTHTLERVAELRAEEESARAELAGLPVLDAAAIEALEAAEAHVVRMRARLEADSARVSLESLGGAGGVLVDGHPVDLEGDDPTELSVGAGLRIEVPGTLRLSIRPAAAQLGEDVSRAEEHRDRLLEQAGADDLAGARAAAAVRERAAGRVRHLGERISDLLAGSQEDRLVAERDHLLEELAGHDPSRPEDYPLPRDVSTARAVARAAAATRQSAEAGLQRAQSALDEHERRCTRLEGQIERASGVNAEMTQRLERDLARLEQVRWATPDEELREAVRAAGTTYAQVESRAAVTRRALEEADVEGVRARLADAERAVAEHRVRVATLREELAQVTGQVELVSGEGRQEAYDQAVEVFLQRRGELAAVHRRARAARQLHETLVRHREAAHRAYVRPYQEEIRRLGRTVYGASFDVDVAEDLTISSRTLEGTTVPFDQLSGGAKEQLGILSRLAVAGLVESGSGVPVIIDDALGYTDPERLQRVSTVFSGPGEHTQVVLLTCTPERYRRLDGATTIRLTA